MKFLVTGSTDGIGRFTASRLAAAGHTVLVHGRKESKVQKAVEEMLAAGAADAEGFVADLSIVEDVRRLGMEVGKKHAAIDGLLNNAGTFDGDYTHKSERTLTRDGNEYSLAVNVLAPFLLTSLLLPNVAASGAGRVLLTSSISMGAANCLDDLQFESGFDAHRAYSLSKLCDAMLLREMHERYGEPPRLCFHTMDPGTVNTKMLKAGWGACGMPVTSATRSLKMLTEAEWGKSSGRCEGVSPSPPVHDPAKRLALWEECERLTGAQWPAKV